MKENRGERGCLVGPGVIVVSGVGQLKSAEAFRAGWVGPAVGCTCTGLNSAGERRLCRTCTRSVRRAHMWAKVRYLCDVRFSIYTQLCRKNRCSEMVGAPWCWKSGLKITTRGFVEFRIWLVSPNCAHDQKLFCLWGSGSNESHRGWKFIECLQLYLVEVKLLSRGSFAEGVLFDKTFLSCLLRGALMIFGTFWVWRETLRRKGRQAVALVTTQWNH